jgi:hypothetical protein
MGGGKVRFSENVIFMLRLKEGVREFQETLGGEPG